MFNNVASSMIVTDTQDSYIILINDRSIITRCLLYIQLSFIGGVHRTKSLSTECVLLAYVLITKT